MNRQAFQLRLDFPVVFGQLAGVEVEQRQRLLEGEQVLRAPVAFEALGDLFGTGADADVLHGGEDMAIAFAGDDGTQDLLPGLADHIGDDVGQQDVHLGERLLQVLHMPRLALKQHLALARQGTQGAHRVVGAERTPEQSIAHELLQPLAVEYVGLAPRDVLVMPGIDQQHLETTPVQEFIQGNPVHTGGCHGDGVYAAGVEPVGQGVQVGGEALELAYRFVVSIRRHRHEVAGRADVDASGVRMREAQGLTGLRGLQGKTAIALHHDVLHHPVWNVAPVRVRRLAHSLKRDIGPAAAHRRADSPMSMTSPRTTLTRGQGEPLLLRSSPALHSTLPQGAKSVFLRHDLRRRAD